VTRSLFHLTGDPKYMDYYERVEREHGVANNPGTA
jgi:hypothetical protein